MKIRLAKHIFLVNLLVALTSVFVSAQSAAELSKYESVLHSGTVEEKRDALFALRNFQSEAASDIARTALTDSDEIVRATAAQTVIFSKHAPEYLAPLFSDVAPFVRREAAYSLGKTKIISEPMSSILVEMLARDKDPEAKTAAAFALGEIGGVRDVAPLTLVFSKYKDSKDAFLRRTSARSIGRIAQRTHDQFPTETTPESFLPEKYKPLRKPKYMRLTETFREFDKANAVLLKFVVNKNTLADERREAIFALGEIGDISSLDVIKGYINSADPFLAKIAEEAYRKAAMNVKLWIPDYRPGT